MLSLPVSVSLPCLLTVCNKLRCSKTFMTKMQVLIYEGLALNLTLSTLIYRGGYYKAYSLRKNYRSVF